MPAVCPRTGTIGKRDIASLPKRNPKDYLMKFKVGDLVIKETGTYSGSKAEVTAVNTGYGIQLKCVKGSDLFETEKNEWWNAERFKLASKLERAMK